MESLINLSSVRLSSFRVSESLMSTSSRTCLLFTASFAWRRGSIGFEPLVLRMRMSRKGVGFVGGWAVGRAVDSIFLRVSSTIRFVSFSVSLSDDFILDNTLFVSSLSLLDSSALWASVRAITALEEASMLASLSSMATAWIAFLAGRGTFLRSAM